ncbi:HlyD family efflux transporter periplasmic adaptor subunit [uncultured Paludibaculum sp.]|uniref:efflux RND transporter periplasmic adaptor subunit n=1 Tax=uncultured Paludibaculum sp. TaxID=1765020 RepID=UPI002AAAE319|nr:HlyD family efflux transporter periplasmic adaptor subunit [uncultured Paludibaculum sp.]
MFRILTAILASFVLAGCSRPASVPTVSAASSPPVPVETATNPGEIRATGKVKAVREFTVQVPQIAGLTGQSSRLTVTKIIASGSKVEAGDTLAEFDQTQQLDNAREAGAKLDDLNHQIAQKRAEIRANAETRASERQQAEADLAKARIQLRKNETLSDIARAQNEEKAAAAVLKLESLKKSHEFRTKADVASVRILELKRDRQAVSLKRAETNVNKLAIKAPHAGMVALEAIWRGDSRGPAQEGDQVYPGQPLVRLFDPTEMEVHTSVGEPDGAILGPGARAFVRLDAYPDLVFPARFLTANPVATADLGSPIKRFTARFVIEKGDPHLLPDLSAAVVITGRKPGVTR